MSTTPDGLRKAPAIALEVDDINTDTKELVVRISSDVVDRDGEVMLPSGMDDTNFKNNPVVLWAHNYDLPPIAKSLWQKVKEREVLARPKFTTKSPFAMEIFDLYSDETMKAWSVGFMPASDGVREMTEDDVRSRPDWAGGRTIIQGWELWEFSAVPVPANPDALALAVKSGARRLPPQVLEAMTLPDVGEVFEWAEAQPNEYCLTTRMPDDFAPGSFRLVKRLDADRPYNVILGVLADSQELVEQSTRYHRDHWKGEAIALQQGVVAVQQLALPAEFAEEEQIRLLANATVTRMDVAKPIVIASPAEIRRIQIEVRRGRVAIED